LFGLYLPFSPAVAVAEMYVYDVRVDDAEILEALRETMARVIDESRQLRAKSEKLIDQSRRLRRELNHLAGRHRERPAETLRTAA